MDLEQWRWWNVKIEPKEIRDHALNFKESFSRTLEHFDDLPESSKEDYRKEDL